MYISSQPSSLTSAKAIPVFQPLGLFIPALIEISSNFRFPLFMYKAVFSWFDVNIKSVSPSLLKSPAATPPPL